MSRARYGVVLAGGRGQRIGGTKGALMVAGRTLVDHVAAAMRDAGLEVVVVAKQDSGVHFTGRVLVEPDEPVHPLAGIAHALGALEAPCVVCPCDMPFVPAEVFQRLASADPHQLSVVEHDGRMQPLVGYYPVDVLPALLAAVESGASATGCVRDLGDRVETVAVTDIPGVDDPDRVMRDIDTREDHAWAQATAKTPPIEITPAQTAARLSDAAPPVILDVREPWEQSAGLIAGAVPIPLNRIDTAPLPDDVVVVCATGARSLAAAAALRGRGHPRARSMAGGMAAWHALGLPVDASDGPGAPDPLARYRRQTVLSDIGEEGQRRLANARVLVVGVGGLGSPCAMYLAAAGVGTIALADDDVVELSNLQRQIIHTTGRVGQDKLASAAETLAALNPEVAVVTHHLRVDDDNAAALVERHDVVVDASDNLATRYALNAACVEAGVPLVWASVNGFEGQMSVYRPGDACYACIFPTPPPPALAPDCASAGVLGATCGVLGSLQAAQVVSLVTRGDAAFAILLMADVREMEFTTVAVVADDDCPVCGYRPPPPSRRDAEAEWLENGTGSLEPGSGVGGVPMGYEAYARVWNAPAGEGDTSGPDDPDVGSSLPPLVLQRLVHHLAPALNEPLCMAVWRGWGDLPRGIRGVRAAVPGRDYLLVEGTPPQLARFREHLGAPPGWARTPNLWWPFDRRWCVFSDTDLSFSVVAGSTELIAAICADPLLDARPMPPPYPVAGPSRHPRTR